MSAAERDCIGWLPACGVKNRRRTFNVCVTSLKNGKEGNTKKGEKEELLLRSSPRSPQSAQFLAYLNSRISAEGFPLPPKQQGDEREKEGTRELRFASQGQGQPRPKTARQLPSSPNRSRYRRKVLNSDTREGPRETEPSLAKRAQTGNDATTIKWRFQCKAGMTLLVPSQSQLCGTSSASAIAADGLEVSESSALLAEPQDDIILTRPTDRPKTAGQIPAFQSHDQRKSSVQATDRPKTAGQIANLQSRAKISAQVKFAEAMMVQIDNVEKQQQRETVHRWRLQKKEKATREAAKKEQRAKEEAEAWAVRVRACHSQLHLLKSHSKVNTASVPNSPRPPPEALVCLDRTRQCFEDLRKQFEEDLTSTKIALAPPEPLRVVNKEMSVDTKVGTHPTSPRQRKERHQFTFREGGGDGTAWDRRFSQQAGGGVNDEWYISYQESAELQAYLRGVLDPSALIVQVGCGNSRLAPALYDDGYKFLINVDISKVAVGVMQRKFRETHPSLVFIAGDATSLAWPDEILDVVLDKGTLQSLLLLEDGVARVAKFAREMWRVLRPGGKMIQIMAGKGMQTYLNLTDLRWAIQHKVIPRKGPGGVANVYKFTKPFCHGALRPTTT